MPHCIIEYSKDLEGNDKMIKTVQSVNQNLMDSGLFDNRTIKIRSIPILAYLVGGEKNLSYIQP